MNPGALRNELLAGDIVFGNVHSVLPYEQQMNLLKIKGSVLRSTFEHAASKEGLLGLQVSQNVRVAFNMSRPGNSRVTSLKVSSSGDFVPVDDDQFYSVAVQDYLKEGKGGFTMLREHAEYLKRGVLDVEALKKIIERKSPFEVELAMDRIMFEA